MFQFPEVPPRSVGPEWRRSAPTLICLCLLGSLVFSLGCRRQQPEMAAETVVEGPIHLRDVTRSTGIDFVHYDGSSGRRFIIEAMSAGLATLDYDNDGLIDIYFLNGAPLPGARVDEPPINRLYRNLGDWTFVDVTQASGTGDDGFGLGVTVGDYNNDGFPDLYINNHGPNVLLRNNGDGTFTDVTAEAGVGNDALVGAGAAFLDIEGDGDLDLYVANYLEFDENEHVERTVNGFPSYPSPRDFAAVPDRLYRNEGDGTFTDISAEAGISGIAGRGMGMVCADDDNDGDTDIFVLNDFGVNFYFRNDGTGNFEEMAILVGLGYNGYGQENASMGVDCADVNNDGLLDFFMTCYQTEYPVFYRNLGEGRFEDATMETQAGVNVFPHVNWGTALIDFDNDGDRDLFIANGHTEDNIDLYDTSTGYKVRNSLLMNDGRGHFTDISDRCGDGLAPIKASKGVAFDDLDNDGRIDGVVLNARELPTVLRNDSDESGNWIQLHLKGTTANRDAVGTRVTVVSGDLAQVAEVHSGRGYQSHFGTRLHFGIGARETVDRIEIRWLGREIEVLEDVPINQLHLIVQGRGRFAVPR